MSILDKLGIDLSPANKEARGFFKGFITEYSKNVKKYNSPEVQEYFHTFISTMMLEFHKSYENFDIRVPYRIKSPKSVFDKVIDYLIREDKSSYEVNADNEPQGKLKEDLADMLAITIVGCNRPSTFFSKDEEISQLIEEKKRNHSLLGEAQRFKLDITKNEFSGTDPDQYNFDLSRRDYYISSIILLERIKTMVHPNATKLIDQYNEMLMKIKSQVPDEFFNLVDKEAIRQNGDKKITTTEKMRKAYRDLRTSTKRLPLSKNDKAFLNDNYTKEDTETVDFLNLFNDFSARIYDKLDLAILTKQVDSVFEKSEVLKKFGVSLDKTKMKEKRTPSGYVSNFIYLNTPFGKIEVQLQSQHENQEGNYGYSAHGKMQGKAFQEFELPELGDEKALQEFRTCVEFISPKKFLATFDNSEPNRIMIQKYGDYQNYKSLITQVTRGSEDYQRLQQYFRKLYTKRDKIFPNEDRHEKIESFIWYDVNKYLKSPKLAKILDNETTIKDELDNKSCKKIIIKEENDDNDER